jgi:RimJ/RimL family protein N-acetyltransferase
MSILEGRLLRLAAGRLPEHDAEMWARWERDTQYRRLLDSEPPRMSTAARIRKEAEQENLPDNKGFGFTVRTLAEDRLLGFTYLGIMSWVHRDAWLAIGLGDRDYWGQGYGTDALRVTLRFAFEELDLHRVTLNVFGNNVRAMRAYERVGFRHEGRLREAMLRDGGRIDILQMGILHSEWIP